MSRVDTCCRVSFQYITFPHEKTRPVYTRNTMSTSFDPNFDWFGDGDRGSRSDRDGDRNQDVSYDYPVNAGIGDIAHRFPRHVPSRILSLASGATVWRPATDIYDTDDAIVVHVDLPGVGKEEINIDVVQDQLTVSGTHKGPEGFDSATSRVRERNIGQFRKIVRLPGNVDTSKVTAKYENGVLEAKIPKTPEKSGTRIQIQ
ncbi:hypothetical protein SeLEV6574_g02833 [Synchytrium endobioticum]|nr:hypothetical protein SeLEV6574_g02833 [Synchytrium endobioticum]